MAWNNNQWGQPQGGYGYNPGGYNTGYRAAGQTNMEWIRVPNIADVEQVTVQAGQTAWIMTQNDSVFAVRAADNMGIVTTRYFRFAQWDPAAADQQRRPVGQPAERNQRVRHSGQPAGDFVWPAVWPDQ